MKSTVGTVYKGVAYEKEKKNWNLVHRNIKVGFGYATLADRVPNISQKERQETDVSRLSSDWIYFAEPDKIRSYMYNITNISKSYRENEVKPTCCRQNTVPASTVSGSYLMQPTCSRQNTVHASTVSGSYLMQPTCSNQNTVHASTVSGSYLMQPILVAIRTHTSIYLVQTYCTACL